MLYSSVNNNLSNLSYGTQILLVLQNGWTGNLYVRKNGLNQIHLYGTLTAGVKSAGTIVTTLPSGYYPTDATKHIFSKGNDPSVLGGWYSISRTNGSFGVEYVLTANLTAVTINDFIQL